MSKPPEPIKALPVQWYEPDTLSSKYATDLIIQHTDQEFILSFFELKLPILTGSIDERKSKALSMDHLQALCVSRIVVSPGRMAKFVEVINENFARYRASQQDRQEG